MEPLSPTAVILVHDLTDILHLNSILVLVDYVGERLTLEIVFRYLSCKYIKIPRFGCKVPFWCVLKENGSLDELGHRGYVAFLVVG